MLSMMSGERSAELPRPMMTTGNSVVVTEASYGAHNQRQSPVHSADETDRHRGDAAPKPATSVVSESKSTGAEKKARERRSTKSKCPPGLRSGKWTPEEEAYTNMIIHYFKRGLLNIEDGTSLRWYLAKRLNCEAMRVTKKLKGNSSIGKQIFRALEDTPENRQAIAAAGLELAQLEQQFLQSLAPQGSATTSQGSAASESARHKRSSPHKPALFVRPPNLEATKLVVPKAKAAVSCATPANSEDAKLLYHFFIEANGSSDGNNIEKKRLFSDIENTCSDDAQSCPEEQHEPISKRQAVRISNLMQ